MNEMATVEYLLKRYIACEKESLNAQECEDTFTADFCEGAKDEIVFILFDRFGMIIEETGTEIRAYNSACSITVRKETLK